MVKAGKNTFEKFKTRNLFSSRHTVHKVLRSCTPVKSLGNYTMHARALEKTSFSLFCHQ